MSKINVTSIREFAKGMYLYYDKNRPQWINEMADYRASKCLPCIKAGKCTECGCHVPGLMYVDSRVDAKNNWPVVKGEEGWKEFKTTEEYIDYESKRIREELLHVVPSIQTDISKAA